MDENRETSKLVGGRESGRHRNKQVEEQLGTFQLASGRASGKLSGRSFSGKKKELAGGIHLKSVGEKRRGKADGN